MHRVIVYIALLGLTIPAAALLIILVRARSALERVLAFDTVVLVLTALIVLVGYLRRSALYLDAALVLALASFVVTVAAARYTTLGRSRQ